MSSSNNITTENLEAYQSMLANEIIPKMSFKFNSKPVSNVKKGTMYNLVKFNSHIINGLEVDTFTFFNKQYGKPEECSLKGFANITNENVKKVLIDKVKNGLKAATSQEFFTEDCDIVLRLNGLSSCSGSCGDDNNIHKNCSQAKNNFEAAKFFKIFSKPPAIAIPCLYNNLVHSYQEYNKLKIYCNKDLQQYTVCNQENGAFILNEASKQHPDENIYASYVNTLKGFVNIRITGIYLKDDDEVLSDTIKLWCTVLKTHLLTPITEINF